MVDVNKNITGGMRKLMDNIGDDDLAGYTDKEILERELILPYTISNNILFPRGLGSPKTDICNTDVWIYEA